MEEIWKDIEGFEGLYKISSLGRIYSVERTDKYGRKFGGCIRKPQKINSGYYIVVLCKNSIHKGFLLHRLVAKHFIPNPNNYPVVNHKDCDTNNNRSNNLEWCTQSYNVLYNDAHKRASKKRYKPILQYTLDGDFIKEWPSISEAAQYFNKNTSKFVCCCKGKRKSAYGFIWRYASDVA